MTNETIGKAFEELEAQLGRTIAIGVYDIERYASMSYEDFCAEEHVDPGTLREDIREYKLGQARRDIEMAQENLKLLTNLREKYGTNNTQDDFIEIARRTLGVFDEKRGRVGDAEGSPAGDDPEAPQGRRDGDRDAERDSGTEGGGSDGGHQDRAGETAGGEEAPRAGGKGPTRTSRARAGVKKTAKRGKA